MRYVSMAKKRRITRALTQVAVLTTLMGCPAEQPKTPEGCAELSSVSARDECYFAIVPDLVRRDPQRGEEAASRIQDDSIRDFTYLTVTREVDPGSTRWCEKIKEPTISARCRVLVSRPHLHRELLKESGGEPVEQRGPPQAGPGKRGAQGRNNQPPPGGRPASPPK